MSASDELDRNKQVIRRMVALVDAGDLKALDQVWSPDLVLHFGAADFTRAQTEAILASLLVSFPDMRHVAHDLIAVDDKVVYRGTLTATHRGPYQGIAATGRPISVGQIAIFRMVDGRIAEYWEQADLMALMQQIGAPPA